MKFITLLAALAAFAILPARAEESPPPPAGPGATVPAPAPTQPGATAPPPVAKKEEEDGASMIKRLQNAAAMLMNSQGITGKLTSLEKDLAAANATIARLTAELNEKTTLLATFDAWLTEQGHTTAKEAAADPAKAFEKAVGSGVAATVRQIGVPAATITTKLNDQAPQALDDIQAQLAACKTPSERQAMLAANAKLILSN